ncbi:hypothetical protein CBR_g39132 [Chara braunii]|uniref:FAS1 domain-containing protein n=1 Tax=Chara braunii TaxID=69332 RepID=A0A388LR13_CHABU|nr:hypothetical protein CBR_g39132 [Chara braunii]|eukprot:GBG84754.1 hypothetical protein CBR_g39132 [Chara braunii]
MAAAMSAAMAALFTLLLVVSPVLIHGDAGGDLMKAIKADQRLHHLHQALITTGFSKELIKAVKDKPVTIFAPLDDAVDAATAAGWVSWDCLTSTKAGKAALKENLKHQVVNGSFYTVWKLAKTNQVIPADGFPIEVTFDKATHLVSLDGYVHVAQPEAIIMKNAIVHLTDGVIATESNYANMLDVCGEAPPSAPPSAVFGSGL